jgi:anti-sigma factor RsiW
MSKRPTMNCDETKKQLAALHDGELESPAARAATDHIAGCGSCAMALDELQSLRAFVQRHGRSSVPAGLLERIEDRAERGIPVAETLTTWLLPRLAAAGLGALCIGGAWWFSDSSTEPHPSPPGERVASYLQASTVSTALDGMQQLQLRPESRVLAWGRLEAKKR